MSMTLGEIRQFIPAMYLASCEDDGPAYHVEGPAGRGKTTLFKQFPAIMKAVDPEGDYGFAYINGLTITLPFLCGFMQLSQSHDASTGSAHEVMRTKFTRPDWWYTREGRPLESYSGGIIFIDEEDKMQGEERKLTRDMKLLKHVGTHYLPPGWVVWSAGNPLGSRNGGTKTFDFIINSQMLITLRDSTEEVVEWQRKNKVLSEIINFTESHSHLVFMNPPTVQGPYMTPRSLAQADQFLRSCMSAYGTKKIPLDPLTQGLIAGGVGKEAAETLFLEIRMGQELPEYSECITNPRTVKIPDEPDRLRLFAYKLADYAKPRDTAALEILWERMPSEFQFMFMKMARDRNAQILIMPETRRWCKNNAQLIAIIDTFEANHKRAA